ncbi:MAG: hypothetical protein WBG86_02940 [Polyangiales bacterium]
MPRIALCCALALGLAPTVLAHADDEALDTTVVEEAGEMESEAASSGDAIPEEEVEKAIATFHGYPTRFARRPLVLNEGMVRADSRITVGGTFGPGTFSSLDIGGAISPIDGLELGLSTELTGSVPAPGGVGLVSIIFSPNASYGDIPVYGRYQFYEGDRGFLAGVDLVMVLPSNTDFTLKAGIPMRVIELFGIFTIDMNVDFLYRNGNEFGGPSNNTFDFEFGGAAAVNLTDHGYVEIGGGLAVANINGGAGFSNVVELPFFLGGGYTMQRKLLVDFFAQFGWLPLMTANTPSGATIDRSTFNVGETWFLAIGATVHTKPLFGSKKSR